MKKCLLILLIPVLSLAQPMDWQPQGIPVEQDGRELPIPFTGGMTDSKPEFVDIDGDGDYDVFIGDNSGKLWFFENVGDSLNSVWEFESDFYDSIYVEMKSSPAFCDIDADSDFDLFTVGYGVIGSYALTIWYYKNNGTPYNPDFEFITDTLAGVYWCQGIDFGDIDNDNDYDLFKGWTGGGGISLYENYGDSSSYLFQNSILIQSTSTHNDPKLCDLDNDEDLDIVYRLENGNVYYLRNDGTPYQYNFTVVTQNLVPDVGVDAAPALVDIDGDGDLDLFAGTGAAGWFTLFGNIHYFENTGSPEVYQFREITDNYFTIDTGCKSVPRLIDIDNDGDLDLFIGNMSGILTYYENIGTASEPHFTLEYINFPGIAPAAYLSPEFVDIDADGDYDLFHGWYTSNSEGKLALYENTGTPEIPQLEVITYDLLGPFNDGEVSPALCDIDNDGDFDLFIGSEWGNIIYYRNDGDSSRFNFNLMNENYQNIDVGLLAKPFFYDIDQDGDYDLFVGCGMYNTYFFENIGNPNWANFVEVSSSWENAENHSGYSAPCLVDIDNDDDADLFIGGADGGVTFYRNQANPSTVVLMVSISPPDVILHWNPIVGASEYRIYTDDTPYFLPTGLPAFTVLPPDTSYIHSDAVNSNTKLFYRVVVGN
ncbi:VCBS repeat-containing protein [bacterium]|nr:VCBS repeat-containing protein [bacterium]